MNHLQVDPHGSIVLLAIPSEAVRLGRPLSPALSLVVSESVFVGIYLHCNQNTCFEMFGFIWVGGL